ncbi:serine hydrolase domain-containing protein [Paraburkholderia phenazinium]|jgi:D-alanyl-D-alanine carboxypeptidase|nr:serine hydrolase domain-containing protein [Paraburkholderia phenazinium]
MVVFVAGKSIAKPAGVAVGLADASAGRPLGVDTPLRIASNTKTFVAATVLRLWEQGRLDLDAPIGSLLSPGLERVLSTHGYATAAMTIRHLLSHSSGLYDHGDDPRFMESVLADPAHAWTREELVRLSVAYAPSPGKPGAAFRYSDTGYVLLGDILERVTAQPLAAVVREALRFDSRGMTSTWWEIVEPQPSGAEPRARQFLGEVDVTDINATMDLYGGGGLVSSARDLATFTADLFEGRVFERPETLAEMLRKGSHQEAEEYRLGISVTSVAGRECYSHLGFWGTAAYYSPNTGIALAGFTTARQGRPQLLEIMERAIAQ